MNVNEQLSKPERGARNSTRLQALYAISDLLRQVVGQGLNVDAVLPRVLQAALVELGAHSGSIIVLDDELEIQHHWTIAEQLGQEGPVDFMRETVREGLFGYVVRTQEPTIVTNTQKDARWLPRPGHTTSQTPWSAMCVPLVIRNRSIGAITMTRPGEAKFDEADIDLLTAIANQAASTIESARLYRESQQRATDLSALVESTSAISARLDTEHLRQLIAEQMSAFARADGCALYELQPEESAVVRRKIHFQDGLSAPPPYFPAEFPLREHALLQRVLEEGFTAHLHAGEDRESDALHEMLVHGDVRSMVLVPMIAQEGAIGLAALVRLYSSRRFAPAQVHLVQTLANQAAAALQNARLYENTQRQLKVTALLNEASQVINSSLDTNRILRSLLTHMNELLNADAGSIALIDKRTNELVYEVAEGPERNKIIGLRLPIDQGLAGWVVHHRVPALVSDTSQDERFNSAIDERTGYHTKSIMCAPLQAKDQLLGIIQAINPRASQFSHDDLQLLTSLANLASVALANARQYQELRDAESRYLSLFENSVNPILLTDVNGIVVEANRRAYEVLGYAKSDLLGTHVAALHVDQEDLAPQTARPGTLPFNGVEDFRTEIRRQGQPPVPVEVYVKHTIFRNNELLQWTYRDISQQVELDKMREDLMAMLVHDLQSPLGNIISSLELLQAELSGYDNAVITAILDIATRSGRRLQALIRSLLDITHLEAGRPVTDLAYADLPALVSEALETVKPTLDRRNLQVVRRLDDSLPKIYGDEDMIRRVIINLLDNAIKYTPGNTTITVEAHAAEEPDRLLVSISDQGRGIPVEYRTAIFDKFRRIQGKQMPKGIGLGLAFCRMAVEGHHGHIWVDDAPGGGARFNFTLPTTSF